MADRRYVRAAALRRSQLIWVGGILGEWVPIANVTTGTDRVAVEYTGVRSGREVPYVAEFPLDHEVLVDGDTADPPGHHIPAWQLANDDRVWMGGATLWATVIDVNHAAAVPGVRVTVTYDDGQSATFTRAREFEVLVDREVKP